MPIKREHVLSAVTVVLRMPMLFVLEVWFSSDPQKWDMYSGHETVFSVIYYLVFVVIVAVGLLPLKKLVTFYVNLVSGSLIAVAWFLCHNLSENVNKNSTEESDNMVKMGFYVGLQCVISATVSYLMEVKDWRRYVLVFFSFPVVGKILGLDNTGVNIISTFVYIFVSLLLAHYLVSHIKVIYKTFNDNIKVAMILIQAIGGLQWFFILCRRILLPTQLFLFWLMLFVTRFSTYWYTTSSNSLSVSQEGWIIIILACVGDCCGTPVSLVALCVTIAYISFYVLSLTKLYLQGWTGVGTEEDMMRGWTEGFTMLLIAMQTGLLELKPLERAFLMSVLLFIVTASLIQSMYEMSDPVLLSLSASHNRNILKHVRVLILFTFLWMFPLYMTYSICQYFDLDLWLLVIMSSCVLTSVQVLGSLVVYTLFMYDSCSMEPWDSLDDVIYYTRAVVRVLEFIVALFVVWYGLKESLFGTWSWINSSILIIHCYFNVWQRFQSGWSSFLLRREAVKRLESLPTATEEQLEKYNDVCPICYQSMSSAKITSCGHYFHASCLKKWLYVKDTCPMCHKKIDQAVPKNDEVDTGPDQPQNNVIGEENQSENNLSPDEENSPGAGPGGETDDLGDLDQLQNNMIGKDTQTENNMSTVVEDTVLDSEPSGVDSSEGNTDVRTGESESIVSAENVTIATESVNTLSYKNTKHVKDTTTAAMAVGDELTSNVVTDSDIQFVEVAAKVGGESTSNRGLTDSNTQTVEVTASLVGESGDPNPIS